MARIKLKQTIVGLICAVSILQCVYFVFIRSRQGENFSSVLQEKIEANSASNYSAKPVSKAAKSTVQAEKPTTLKPTAAPKTVPPNPEIRRFPNQSFSYFLPTFPVDRSPIKELFDNRKSFCDGKFTGFDGKMAKFQDILLNPAKGKGRAGGEKDISKIFNQDEKLEYLTLSKGYFLLKCKPFQYGLPASTYLPGWFDSIEFSDNFGKLGNVTTIDGITFALVRYEYAHLLFNVVDFYHAFLAMMVLRIDKEKINILLIDSHPESTLDSAWPVLFGKIYRAGALQNLTIFKTMVWQMQGYSSPMHFKNKLRVPYLEEFRHFILSKFNVTIERKLNCSNMTIMFVWRRNYVAHPRNPSGQVSRKVKNEQELLNATAKSFAAHKVFGIQLDKYTLKQQLEFATNADIMVGLHGAGFTLISFMQKYAGLVEMFPAYFAEDDSYSWIAEKRNVHYLRWKNTDRSIEHPNMYTQLPPDRVINLLQEMKGRICSSGRKA